MSVCPQGHASDDDEFCDLCGLAIGGTAGPAVRAVGSGAALDPGGPHTVSLTADPDTPPPGTRCASCGGDLSGRFCEVCGHDWLQPVTAPAVSPSEPAASEPPLAQGSWVARVSADRAYFDSVVSEGPTSGAIGFPPFCPERTFRLAGTQVTVGRASRSRGIHPDIDLTGPPEDPGVSHLHAMLLARDDGGWSVVDLGSANGTDIGGVALPANAPRPVSDGDVIHLGAWTRITLRRG